jgi:hypothetical protein
MYKLNFCHISYRGVVRLIKTGLPVVRQSLLV